MGKPMSNRRIDGVFGNVTFHPEVICITITTLGIFFQRPSLYFHFMRSLPSANHHLTNTPHRLRIRRHNGKRTGIVKNIFCSNGFPADTRFSKRHIFSNRRIQMMAHHQHIQMFINGIDGKWSCGIGGRRNNILG